MKIGRGCCHEIRATRKRPVAQCGALMVACLVAVAVLAAASTVVVTRWADELRREQEQELLVVGDQIAAAIESYRRMSAGSRRQYPPELESLIEDTRGFGTVRHLRKLYPDPLGRGSTWGLIRDADGGVRGVYSRSDAVPLRQTPVRLRHVDLAAAVRYADWRFEPRRGAP